MYNIFQFFLNGSDFKLIDVKKKKEDTLVDNEYQKQYYSLEHQFKKKPRIPMPILKFFFIVYCF